MRGRSLPPRPGAAGVCESQKLQLLGQGQPPPADKEEVSEGQEEGEEERQGPLHGQTQEGPQARPRPKEREGEPMRALHASSPRTLQAKQKAGTMPRRALITLLATVALSLFALPASASAAP